MTQDDEITTDQARAHFLAKIVARDLQAAAEREADLQVRILELEQLVVQERIAHKDELAKLQVNEANEAPTVVQGTVEDPDQS